MYIYKKSKYKPPKKKKKTKKILRLYEYKMKPLQIHPSAYMFLASLDQENSEKGVLERKP